jgi:thioesterase domain-containing protein
MAKRTASGQPSLAIHFQLIEIWQRVLGARVPTIDKSFFNLGGNPLLMRRMLEEVSCLTGRRSAPNAFLKNPTIAHLAQCLLRQKKNDGMFLHVQGHGGNAPFYFLHGDILGGGFYARRLAEFLHPDQPFYISPPVELQENELPRVEELAACKRTLLQKHQPHGPYVLGGFCVGAVMAYEIARQLERAGEEVRNVILIEPEIGNVVTRSHLKVVNRIAARGRDPRDKVHQFMQGLEKIDRLRHVWRAPLREKARFLVKNSKKILAGNVSDLSSTEENPGPATDDNARESETSQQDWLLSAYHWVLTSYVPKRYRGRVTLLLTEEQLNEAPYIVKQWRKAAPQIRVEHIPGRHLTCITTHVGAMARKIRRELEKVQVLLGMLLPALGSQLWNVPS